MKGKLPGCLFALLITAVVALPSAADELVGQQISIVTGGETGVYYAVGEAICRQLNRTVDEYGLQCQALASSGGVANVRTLLSGQAQFALMQSSHQYKVHKGLAPFDKDRRRGELRTLFALHYEVFTILAHRDAAIQHFDDLKGKRLNIGNSGSGQRDTFEEIMQARGWSHSDFSVAAELEASEQSAALGDRNIDAMIYFVGHPNTALQEASSVIDARIVSVGAKTIDQLLLSKPYYRRARVPGGLYRGNPEPVPSIGTRAVFTATSRTNPDTVYQVVRAVFENLDRLRRAHPALDDLNERSMFQVGDSAILHEGAKRYYKERGWL